ncbi:hypothetical protein [Clostridium polyendosporum]|uniref:hypothetical protein n=1 Tax=Clostridium polyendosporum TaxID=69208 RepID=UPI001BB3936E|nr:hypothetical protein [Clostridium polyendosporum]
MDCIAAGAYYYECVPPCQIFKPNWYNPYSIRKAYSSIPINRDCSNRCLTINLNTIKCVREINESSASEEPYVLVTSVDLRRNIAGVSPVNLNVVRYGIWEDFDEGETKTNSGPPFWGVNHKPEDIANIDDVIFIVSLLENDNGNPDQYRTLVLTVATISLNSTLGEPDRSVRARRLLQDITNALNGVDLPIPFALDDDHIGTVELRLDGSDLISAGTKQKKLTIRSAEGHYELTFQITSNPSVSSPLKLASLGQADWRYCGKCHSLFFDGYPDKGKCAAGGSHEAIGYNFVLPHNVPPTSKAQGDWEFCVKCHGMFFNGYPDKGKCPAGGGHQHHPNAYRFVLPHNVPPTSKAQGDWEFCVKCYGMFFNGYPDKGKCPAGGGHQHHPDAYRFVLPHN